MLFRSEKVVNQKDREEEASKESETKVVEEEQASRGHFPLTPQQRELAEQLQEPLPALSSPAPVVPAMAESRRGSLSPLPTAEKPGDVKAAAEKNVLEMSRARETPVDEEVPREAPLQETVRVEESKSRLL